MSRVKKISKMIFIFSVIFTLTFGTGYFSANAQQIETQSTCSHTWSGWQIKKITYERGPSFGDCNVRKTQWIRGCTKCGELDSKETSYQMTHDWYTKSNGDKVCNNCGTKISTCKMEIQ